MSTLGGLHSSYYFPDQFYNPYYGEPSATQQRAIEQREREQRKREQEYFARQSRRSQYLPSDDEEDLSDEGSFFYEATPRERIYRDGRKRRGAYERRRREEEIYNQQRQEQLRQEQERRRQAGQDQKQRQQPDRRPRSRQRSTSRPPQQARAPSQQPQAPVEAPAPPAPPQPPQPPPPPETVQGPPTQPPRPSPPPERVEAAAKTLQKAYRIRRSHAALKDLEREFKYLKSHYSLPKQIDFQKDEPIPIPGLAFNRTNYELLSYIEALNRLLTKLDSVESWGDPSVRHRRKRLVSRVEAEANRIEAFLRQAWLAHLAEQSKEEKVGMET
ncbi:putative BAG domain containing protein [Lyophyllum shimeji]|uniref:BAG domain containing protein n=1 Tax=Lyophyllum shimeji TaxID=47721 RepID=A0A9P3PZ89_LYOSH|nr:putative BAG domain containing protein [Lyophyllum shimeji]